MGRKPKQIVVADKGEGYTITEGPAELIGRSVVVVEQLVPGSQVVAVDFRETEPDDEWDESTDSDWDEEWDEEGAA